MAGSELKRRRELLMPDLQMPGVTAVASLWLVEEGGEVTEGDRLLEVLAGDVTVDLPAPASGRLVDLLVGEEDALIAGQVLAVIEVE